MPPHHLTTASPHQLADSVLAVLTGMDLETVADDAGVDPATLDEATTVYQAAGLAALERQAEAGWYQLRVQFPDSDNPEMTGADEIGPRLEQLRADGLISGWWFLRKPPGWRLRLRDADIPAINRTFNELAVAGALTRWWPTVYEPETAAFGGPAGMDAAHDLFHADSLGVLDYVRQYAPDRGRQYAPDLGRRELSILLINALMQAGGLDWFERGDVFARVTQLRPAPALADIGQVEKLSANVRTLLAIPTQPNLEPFAPGGLAAFAAPWLTAWQAAGNRLGRAAAEGRLDRGLRALLTHVVIFHWNRLGLSATTQGILSRAATTAYLPES